MGDNIVEMTILTSNKSGVLSFIMIKSGKAGLMYRRNHTDKLDDDTSRMVISFEGSLKCSKQEFIDVIEADTGIYSVESISLGGAEGSNTSPVSNSTAKTSIDNANAVLNAHETITPESLQIAEAKLLSTLGPVAPMLIKSAAAKTKHIGDLYALLAEELDAQERADFLALVSGLD